MNTVRIKRSRRSTAKTLFNTAKLLSTFASVAAGYVGAQNRAELDALKSENLRLRSINANLQQGVISNRVLEGDLKVELLKLKIEAEKRKLGIVDTPYDPKDYS